MANFYPYLVSSLPMLNFGMRLPLSREKFLRLCANFIPGRDLEILQRVTIEAKDYSLGEPDATLRQWVSFDTALRNELVKLRALRRHIEPAEYLRTDGFADSWMVHTALHAARNPSPQEGERALDEARWRFLDSLSMGHYFDLAFLVVYALKLLLLEKWERLQQADKALLVEETLAKINL
jgi:hypothetical protein